MVTAMGKYERVKGHTLERETVSDFRDLLGYSKAKTSRAASKLADDCKIDVVGIFPFAPQCKNLQNYASPNEVLKIETERYCEGTDGLEGRKMIPMLITKANNKPKMVTLKWEDLIAILQQTPYNKAL